jgi:hypothetical protein
VVYFRIVIKGPLRVPGNWLDWATLALLAGTAGVLLASPSFPSQDGPVHLYYVDVLRGLLTHSGPYSQYFRIKAFFTPYALEYYSLLVLELGFSPAVSEKLLLCVYIFGFGFGFRYLVGSVSERSNPWTLAGIPFCMNMLVYLGFLNFCLGVALTLFMCGLWIRFSERLTPGSAAGLLAGLLLMLLAHPVAVAVFLLFIGLYVVAEVVQEAAANSWSWAPSLLALTRQLVLMAVMDVISLAWIGVFVDRTEPALAVSNYASQVGLLQAATSELELLSVAPFTSLLDRIGLLLLLGMVGLTVIGNPWKQAGRVRSGPLALMATSAICFILFCFVPPQLNGTWYFAERFPIFWVLFLIATTAALRPPLWWSNTAGVIAFCVTVSVLAMQWVHISRIAREVRPALEAPAAKSGSVGLIVGDSRQFPPGLAFDPYIWAGVHYFRRSGAILANAPWTDQSHIMIQPAHSDRWSYTDPDGTSHKIADALAAGDRFPEIDFLVQEGLADVYGSRLVNVMEWDNFTGDHEYLRFYRRRY